MKVVVNLNETVRFKLTEHGKEVYRAQFDELNEFLKSKRAPLCHRPEPDIDAEGYTKMQLWSFMGVFGPHTGVGLKPCIEPIEIVVDVESYKKEAVMMPQKYIPLEAAITAMTADNLLEHFDSVEDVIENRFHRAAERILASIPAANVVEIPDSGIGELSDGYHTFNGLYYQRMALFAALVNAYNDKAWKSWRHEDGKPCFDGGWFIVGIDTPKGSYTYHYEDKYWNWFECEELPTAKHWDGHTEEDVTRLLTLAADVVEAGEAEWRYQTMSVPGGNGQTYAKCSCSACKGKQKKRSRYCPDCGKRMKNGGPDNG